jgi:hypothetical protein
MISPSTQRLDASMYRAAQGTDLSMFTVYEEKDPDHYEFLGRIATAPGAATGRLVPELGEYVTFVPARKTGPAEVLVFDVK